VTGFCFIVGILGLIALPPFGGFWSLMAILEGLAQSGQWGLVGVVILTNGIAAFALVRMFGLMFAGDRTPFTARSPEPLWLIVLPTAVMAGFVLHMPFVVKRFSLYPDSDLSWSLGWPLFLSSVVGVGLASAFYLLERVENPKKLIPVMANRLLAYDFYTPRIYQMTAIALVDKLSLLTDWLDRYVVDGLVNFIGLGSLFSGEALKYINTGKLQLYALTIASFVVGICVYLSWGYFSV
jgi:NAD(P)H-quinone oxidoreductase subunit 5